MIGLISAAWSSRFLLGRQLLHPRRQRVGDATRTPCTELGGRAAAGRPQHVAARRRDRRRLLAVGAVSRAGRVQVPASSCCSARSSSGWSQAWSERASRPTPPTTPTCASACSTRSSSRSLAALGRRRRHLLVLADHAVASTREAGPVVFVVARRPHPGVRIPVRRRSPALKHGRRGRRSCAIGALGLVSTGAVIGHRGPARHRGAPDDRYRQQCGLPVGRGRPEARRPRSTDKGFAGRGRRRASVGHDRRARRTANSAYEQASTGRARTRSRVSRGNAVNVIFKNRDPEKRRLTVTSASSRTT